MITHAFDETKVKKEIEPEEYYEQLYEEEPYGGLKQTEEEMVELLESMSPAEIDDFSDWLVAEGNENYLFTFLQMLDNQLVDKFNEDIEEENEIINVLSNIESLAADVAEKEKAMAVAEMVRPEVDYFPKRTLKREVSPDFYPQAGGFLVYGPEKRMVLAREAMNPEKRWGLW
ncbi:uncharacterized protein LOC134855927 [Symsagittifera roscoffensis]|uniref:uncharacterized protein LOC134855927 n=1 Tax=Symsagittifera roscoffensis TaxID=84072 RepID=UPI00307B8AF6